MSVDRLFVLYDRVAEAPNAVGRLRRFVLDLAVRGKLVEQGPADKPATELLKRIAAKKAQLVKAGEIRKPKPVAPAAEFPFEVPSTWQWTQLGLIASYIQRGKSPKYAVDKGSPVVSQKCIQWRGLDLSVAKQITLDSLEKYERIRLLREGDLLWNSTGTGTIGRVIRLVRPAAKLVCDSHVTVVRCLEVDSEYIRTWLRTDHVYGVIEKRATGATNQVELTARMANKQLVPLPPLAEQHRIVAKVDELMVLCDQLEEARTAREDTRDRLTKASLTRLIAPDIDAQTFRSHARFAVDALAALSARADQVKHLRQTILNLAVRGKLVEQDPADEPASELLHRIAADRVKLEKNGSLKKSRALPPVDVTDAPFDLPMGWAWVRFPEIGLFGRGKSKHRPRNDPILYTDGKYPFIQTGDVARSRGSIETYSKLYNDVGLAQSARWPTGTLCITIAANIANSGILLFDACFPDSVVGLIVHDCFGDARFFDFFIRVARADLQEFAPSTAQKNINLGILLKLLIPLPPLAEMHRIVAKVDELMLLCDRLEASISGAADIRHRLLESLLHDALASAVHDPEAARRLEA